jgi:hypothetical protein
MDEESKDPPKPEKVHVLEPYVYQADSNSAMAFPTPKSLGAGRTAFYAQQRSEPEGGIFGDEGAPAEFEESEKKPVRAQWTKDNHKLEPELVLELEPVINRGHTTFYNKQRQH